MRRDRANDERATERVPFDEKRRGATARGGATAHLRISASAAASEAASPGPGMTDDDEVGARRRGRQ